MTVYLSGAISGIPDSNKKAFSDAYRSITKFKANTFLRDMKIINPHHIARRVEKCFALKNASPLWPDYMRACIKKLCECDCAFFLPSWPASEGASLERHIAKRLGIPCADSIKELKEIFKEIYKRGKNEN